MPENRATLLLSLKRYCQKFPDRKSIASRFERLLEQKNCFQRDHYNPGHITASAWLVDKSKRKVLLTHHLKLDKWLQLGGHTDGNENTLESAGREAREESGINSIKALSRDIYDLDIHIIPSHKAEPAHEHFDIRYVFICCGDENFSVSEESHDLRWVPIEHIRDFTSEVSMLRMANHWSEAIREHHA